MYLLTFALSVSPPSLVNLSKEGITIPNNWITIEAVIYGVIDIANIENLEKAPPVNVFISCVIPFDPIFASRVESTVGTEIKHPSLKMIINNSVYHNLFLTSGVFKAFFMVLNN